MSIKCVYCNKIIFHKICKKLFSRKDNLREHMKGHTGQTKPRAKLPCPIASCGKEFQGRTQLQVHLNFHSGLRPYMCEWEGCRKSFRSNAALRKHTRTHNYDRPFHCQQVTIKLIKLVIIVFPLIFFIVKF